MNRYVLFGTVAAAVLGFPAWRPRRAATSWDRLVNRHAVLGW
jgi:hypothetical protein